MIFFVDCDIKTTLGAGALVNHGAPENSLDCDIKTTLGAGALVNQGAPENSLDCDIKTTLGAGALVNHGAPENSLDCAIFATVPGKTLQKQRVTRCLTKASNRGQACCSKAALLSTVN